MPSASAGVAAAFTLVCLAPPSAGQALSPLGFAADVSMLVVGEPHTAYGDGAGPTSAGFQLRGGLLFPWGSVSLTGLKVLGEAGVSGEASTNTALDAWAVAAELRLRAPFARWLSLELGAGWGRLTASQQARQQVGERGDSGFHSSVGLGFQWEGGAAVLGAGVGVKTFAHVHGYDFEFGPGDSEVRLLWTAGFSVGVRSGASRTPAD